MSVRCRGFSPYLTVLPSRLAGSVFEVDVVYGDHLSTVAVGATTCVLESGIRVAVIAPSLAAAETGVLIPSPSLVGGLPE